MSKGEGGFEIESWEKGEMRPEKGLMRAVRVGRREGRGGRGEGMSKGEGGFEIESWEKGEVRPEKGCESGEEGG